MAGFDCEFVEKPPEYLQTHCPICLLVLCEPYQVTCCGKSFCRECIQELKARYGLCPTCKQERFECFPNKGLQQPLYGFRVFCSNKESGCAWEGKLGQLDQHINSNPDKEKQLVGCIYTSVSCIYCGGQHQRQKIEEHQASLCVKRPFSCSMCEEYKSTYNDVMNSHAPVCKCRPVECPNSCGADNLQHQHLEEHVSSQCPLTLVKCEFGEAGCAAKVYRKDLPSHLTDNIVTHMSQLANHMSLLTMENKRLNEEVKRLNLELQQQKLKQPLTKEISAETKVTLEAQYLVFKQEQKLTKSFLSRVPPLDILCPFSVAKCEEIWTSEPFYSHIGGYKLCLEVDFDLSPNKKFIKDCNVSVSLSETEFEVRPELQLAINVVLVNNRLESKNHTFAISASKGSVDRDYCSVKLTQAKFLFYYAKNYELLFRVTDIVKSYSSTREEES